MPAILPPTAIINEFFAPFPSINNNQYTLLNNYGANWSYPGATNGNLVVINGQTYTNVTPAMYLKASYPGAQRTILLTGLTNGNYDVYVYYSCPTNIAPASINGQISTPNPNPAQAQYWYANVNTQPLPAPANYNAALSSTVTAHGDIRSAQQQHYNQCGLAECGRSGPRRENSWHTSGEPCQCAICFTCIVRRGGKQLCLLDVEWFYCWTNYLVYRVLNGTTNLMVSENQLQYQDVGLAPNTQCSYFVVGQAPGGILNTSVLVSATPFGCAAPLPPRIDYVNTMPVLCSQWGVRYFVPDAAHQFGCAGPAGLSAGVQGGLRDQWLIND